MNQLHPDAFTIEKALNHGYQHLSSSYTSHLEAQLLLCHLLHVQRSYLYTHQNQTISKSLWQQYQELIQRRSQGEPMAYLVGHKEFWSLQFEVDSHTLIPRPETELLVELALMKLPEESNLSILDMGTGTGAIAMALASERPHWEIHATDISSNALEIAKKNAATLQLKNVILLQSDWYSNLPPIKFDAILSNPPYIAQDDPHLESLGYEPKLALEAGKDGLDAIKQILQGACAFLKKDGLLLVEHGFDQGERVRILFENAGFTAVETYLDLNNLERVTGGRIKEEKC